MPGLDVTNIKIDKKDEIIKIRYEYESGNISEFTKKGEKVIKRDAKPVLCPGLNIADYISIDF